MFNRSPEPAGATVINSKIASPPHRVTDAFGALTGHVLAQHQPPLTIDVRICQIDRERRIVVPQIRSQQQGLPFVECQFEPGQVAGIGIEQAIRPARRGTDITVTVEHDESVVMAQSVGIGSLLFRLF